MKKILILILSGFFFLSCESVGNIATRIDDVTDSKIIYNTESIELNWNIHSGSYPFINLNIFINDGSYYLDSAMNTSSWYFFTDTIIMNDSNKIKLHNEKFSDWKKEDVWSNGSVYERMRYKLNQSDLEELKTILNSEHSYIILSGDFRTKKYELSKITKQNLLMVLNYK